MRDINWGEMAVSRGWKEYMWDYETRQRRAGTKPGLPADARKPYQVGSFMKAAAEVTTVAVAAAIATGATPSSLLAAGVAALYVIGTMFQAHGRSIAERRFSGDELRYIDRLKTNRWKQLDPTALRIA